MNRVNRRDEFAIPAVVVGCYRGTRSIHSVHAPTRAGNEGVKTGCDQDREVSGPAYSVSIAKVTRAVRQ